MKTIKSWILTLALAVALQASSNGAETNTTVVPYGFQDVSGNTLDSYFLKSPLQYQALFTGAYLSSMWKTPVEISAISFRANENGFDLNRAIPSLKIELSTTQRAPHELSTNMESNKGNDNRLVYDHENVAISAEGSLVLNPFQIRFELDHPFYYDPTQGNFLMDFRAAGSIDGLNAVDAQIYGFVNPSSPYAEVGPNGMGGYEVIGGVVITEFQFRAVPEPTQQILLFAGGVVILSLCRRNFVQATALTPNDSPAASHLSTS